MPSILILASGPLCRNPRALKEAQALGNAGFEVTVAAIANSERFEAYDRELMVGASFRKVTLDRFSPQPGARIKALADRAAGRLARAAIRWGIESPATLGPFGAFSRLALSIPADLTIVHAELALCVGAGLISRGRRVAADFEDWHSRDLLASAQASRPLRLLRRTEEFLMRRSAYTSAPSAAMAAALKAAYGDRLPLVIPNTFPLQADPGPLPRRQPPAFFWFSQTVGEGRGLEQFIAAWALTRAASRLCLLGDVTQSYRRNLIDLVPQARRADLTFLPLASPGALPTAIAAHDIGLALEAQTPESRNLTATNKIFQYLNAGLAIVATSTAGQREIMSVVPGSGIMVDFGEAKAAASRLDGLLGNPAALAEMGAAARRGAEEHFCWERTSPGLVAAVGDAIRGQSHP